MAYFNRWPEGYDLTICCLMSYYHKSMWSIFMEYKINYFLQKVVILFQRITMGIYSHLIFILGKLHISNFAIVLYLSLNYAWPQILGYHGYHGILMKEIENRWNNLKELQWFHQTLFYIFVVVWGHSSWFKLSHKLIKHVAWGKYLCH